MNREKTNTLLIKTPEGIVFPIHLAGPVTRFLAWGIDLSCILAVSGIAGAIIAVLDVISLDVSRAFAVISYFLASIGYGIATEWYWRGQTLGKRLLGLRVMDVQGLRLHFSQIVIRNLMRFVDGLPAFYFVGGAACVISGRAQRLGDVVANTIVVRNPKLADPDLSQIMSGKYNSFREYPHIAARLRQNTGPHEAGLALQALLRRDEFEPAARVELFGRIASHFRAVAAFPEEVSEGITDEQYVRNAVDILFDGRKRTGRAEQKEPI